MLKKTNRYFSGSPENKPQQNAGSKTTPKVQHKKGIRKQQKSHAGTTGTVHIDEAKVAKYKRVASYSLSGISSEFKRKKIQAQKKKVRKSVLQATRAELLLPEDVGFLEADEGEDTVKFYQHQIAEVVDITSATKHFDLNLPEYGPYSVNYSRDGRHLLLGGHRGHVAALDWVTKHLLCEMNVMESVHDVQWLHMPTMYAVAQKSWTYIYDNQGTELHCLKMLDGILKMCFLPYHFLLATSSERGFLSWLDVSIGKMVAQFSAKSGRLNIMKQNPYNATLLTGHPNGVVKIWSPNINEPLVSMLCSKATLRDIAVDDTGMYLATAATDRTLKIWDLRTYKCLKSYKLKTAGGHLSFSQRHLLAVSLGSFAEVYKDCCRSATVESPYLRHKAAGTINALEFCPYEDVLGIGHQRGFTSILVPGSGEPNFDALESNPYMTKSQRQEMEVKALLDKIQPELICLDPKMLGKVDLKTLQTKVEENNKKKWLKPITIDTTPMVGKERRKAARAKAQLKAEKKRQLIQGAQKEKTKKDAATSKKLQGVLDRFKPKS
ncbi:WD repeat-containing protein 46-like [Ornithodoros turicata]|uniref:WD repeat-containing protein 46-like n=1 Tax=Ornithodoros turicata TaxID=34597 RepID=UPI0031394125